MNLRLSALAALLIGVSAPSGPVAAQYYPLPDHRWGPPPPAVVLPEDDDDDPVIYTRRAPRGYLDREYRAPDPRYAYPEERRVARPGVEPDDDPRGPYGAPPAEPPPVIYGGRPGEASRVYGRPLDPPPSDPNAPRPPGLVPGAPASAEIPPPVQLAPGDHTGSIPPAAGERTGSIAPLPGERTGSVQPPNSVMILPPEDQPETGPPKELPPHLKRQTVDYRGKEPAGTIVIDTANTYLYFVLGGGKAMRYGIGVGREGFTWAGREKVSRKAEWPDWHPPQEMIERQPYLPRFMAGGPGNPLGARALYLGKTLYRIHGTNQPSTIGQFVSSGCVRLLNEDIEDLYERVKVNAQVVVLPGNPPATAAAPPAAREADAGSRPLPGAPVAR
jgi:lipoprotein-anchoring transpeptidase ErfK/SrfK